VRKITVQDIDLVYDLGDYLRWCRKIGIAANLAMSRKKTVDVGSFTSNAFGLHDMHGNVWEWVEDCYKDNHVYAAADGKATEGYCYYHALRGGSWDKLPRDLRSSVRDGNSPGYGNNSLGFRLARTLSP
jgi:formylglycine-generating enzyme required for sulfatase activity